MNDPLCMICTPGLCQHGEQSPDSTDFALSAQQDRIRMLESELDGAKATVAAAKRELIVERARFDEMWMKWRREAAACEMSVRLEEREQCARLANIPGHAVAQSISAAILARGGQ